MLRFRLLALCSALLVLTASLSASSFNVPPPDSVEVDVPKRVMIAHRTAKAPIIDGVLEADLYDQVASTGEFTNLEPTFGPMEQWPTEVKLLYDDRALYIAATMWYPTKDSVSNEVRARDRIGNADWFGVAIDPYLSGVNGFEFISVVTGGQFDAVMSDQGEDESWDAVWKNAVQQTETGWTLEMEIPYSAIRFPDEPIQTWGINFFRRNASAQQKSFWNPVDPQKAGFLTQFGRLEGIQDISPPARIQLTPFGVVTGADYIDPTAKDIAGAKTHNFDMNASAGADLKLGLSDAFTLDMTLIPDFSEARQDNQILNLSPFEVQFSENRPFFTEGVELFNKGDYFYSRRVGGVPLGFGEAYDEADRIDGEVVSNPGAARILNASKVSGRTNKGTGVGVFNAVTARSTATLKTTEGGEIDFVTQPLTNYNVLVVDQLIPNNGFVSLVNTNVLRNGATYDANLTATVFDIRNKENSYGLSGTVGVSQLYYPGEKAELGQNIDVEFGDIDGNWTWDISYEEIGSNYDPSDLGFFRRRNVREVTGYVGYSQNEEWGPLNRFGFGSNVGYERYIEPNEFSEFWFNVYSYGRTKSNWNFNPFIYVEPMPTRDRFEPRIDGMFFERPASLETGLYIGSDQRKKFQFGVNLRKEFFFNEDLGRNAYNLYFSPSYRVSNNFTLGWQLSSRVNQNNAGFATFTEVDGEDVPVFGQRDRDVIENSLSLRYTVTPNLSFNLDARHYWSKVDYTRYFDLESDGSLTENADYLIDIDRDETFNALTADLVCRWRFAPGSDLLLVWKDALFTGVDAAERGYFGTWKDGLMSNPRTETLSLKVNYFLDWDTVRRGRI
ncbi:MAG: DUF5916 domain-containing protein [Saprospiraceae bacterium]